MTIPAQTTGVADSCAKAFGHPRGSYCQNPNPTFKLPEKMFHTAEYEALGDKYTELKKEYEQVEKEVGNAKRLKRVEANQRKKVHWFIRYLLKKLDGIDIFQSDYLVYMLGNRRALHSDRKRVIRALFEAFASLHDVMTGYLPKSCLSTLSNQIGATTYGHKRYGEYAEQPLPPTDVRGKKASISRVSRAVKQLREWGIVEVDYVTDPVTGKILPTIIRVTDRFYDLLMVGAEEVDRARAAKLNFGKFRGEYSDSDLLCELERMRNEKKAALIKEREVYALRQRKRKHLTNLTPQEIRDTARQEVRHYLGDRLKRYGFERYSMLVQKRTANLMKLRKCPDLPDTFFEENPFRLH